MSLEEEQSIQQPDHAGLKRVGGAMALGFAVAGGLGIAHAKPAAAYERTPDGVTVEQGDTIWDIVRQETGAQGNTLVHDVEAVARTNHLSDPGRIMPGQHLKLETPRQSHAPPGETYTLKYRDTIWDTVKAHYGYVSASLVKQVAQNSGIDMDKYYPGQVVRFVDQAKPASLVDNHHGLRQGQPEKAQEIPKATVTITSRDQTIWALASIVAAVNHTSQEEAVKSVMAANPGVVPEQLQFGDKVSLPGVSDKTLRDVMAGVQYMLALQQASTPTSPQPMVEQNLAVQAARQPRTVQVLAHQIITNPNITIEPSPDNRVAKSIADIQDNGSTFTHDMVNPGQTDVSPRLLQIVEGLATEHHVTIGSLTTGDHVANSDHFRGEAVDIEADTTAADTFKELYDNRQALGIDDLIYAYPPAGTTTLDGGQPAQYDAETIDHHKNHIHVSVKDKEALPEPPAPAPEPTAAPEAETVSPAPFSLETNILSQSGLSVDQLNKILDGTGFAGLGQAFHNLEIKYGINALFAISHGAIESSWGTSDIAKAKNNPFGMSAFDSCPMSCADSFGSYADSIDAYGHHLSQDYLNPSGKWYSGGTTIHNVFVHYSSSHDDEGNSVAGIMNESLQKANG